MEPFVKTLFEECRHNTFLPLKESLISHSIYKLEHLLKTKAYEKPEFVSSRKQYSKMVYILDTAFKK